MGLSDFEDSRDTSFNGDVVYGKAGLEISPDQVEFSSVQDAVAYLEEHAGIDPQNIDVRSEGEIFLRDQEGLNLIGIDVDTGKIVFTRSGMKLAWNPALDGGVFDLEREQMKTIVRKRRATHSKIKNVLNGRSPSKIAKKTKPKKMVKKQARPKTRYVSRREAKLREQKLYRQGKLPVDGLWF